MSFKPLTKQEKELVLKRIREYPAKILSKFWGFGPMSDSPMQPQFYPQEVRNQYGWPAVLLVASRELDENGYSPYEIAVLDIARACGYTQGSSYCSDLQIDPQKVAEKLESYDPDTFVSSPSEP